MAKKDYTINRDCRKCINYHTCQMLTLGKDCEYFKDQKTEVYEDKVARRKALHKFYKKCK